MNYRWIILSAFVLSAAACGDDGNSNPTNDGGTDARPDGNAPDGSPDGKKPDADIPLTCDTAITTEHVDVHLKELQAIAGANEDTRASGTPGYEASRTYVINQLSAAGYTDVSDDAFAFAYFKVNGGELRENKLDSPTTYEWEKDVYTLGFSAPGEATATLQAVDVDLEAGTSSTSGCEPEDFAGFPSGAIAILQRGVCGVYGKVKNAEAAGATGVILINYDSDPGTPEVALYGETVVQDTTIPAVGVSYDAGKELVAASGTDQDYVLKLDVVLEERQTQNAILERTGTSGKIFMIGGHLDSVTNGPGINDNGSGIAALLEVAKRLATCDTTHTLRIAFWGGEEAGAVGAWNYVDAISEEDIANYLAYVNLDMVGSKNGVNMIYLGVATVRDDEANPGSIALQQTYEAQYEALSAPYIVDPALIGRSDHLPFDVRGVAVGGLFSGAEGIKTAEQVAVFGGTADEPFDPCYHASCDSYDNVDLERTAGAANATLGLVHKHANEGAELIPAEEQ